MGLTEIIYTKFEPNPFRRELSNDVFAIFRPFAQLINLHFPQHFCAIWDGAFNVASCFDVGG